jgi:hypothetical protein
MLIKDILKDGMLMDVLFELNSNLIWKEIILVLKIQKI